MLTTEQDLTAIKQIKSHLYDQNNVSIPPTSTLTKRETCQELLLSGKQNTFSCSQKYNLDPAAKILSITHPKFNGLSL